jgi:hypothetical protein
MALIGQPAPDDVYTLAADLLEANAALRAENGRLRKAKDYYRGRLSAKQRKARAWASMDEA